MGKRLSTLLEFRLICLLKAIAAHEVGATIHRLT